MIRQYGSIIFDLDGTLWEPTETCVVSWNEVLSTFDEIDQPITAEAIQSVFGMKVDLITGALFPSLSKEQQYIKKHGAKLYEELEPILATLKQTHRLFIVSNCQSGYIESFLDYYGLQSYFTDFECPGNTGLDKSENIKLIIERNHLSSPIYVGDTMGDFEAAKLNQLPFYFAEYGFGSVKHPDVRLKKLSDLMSE